MSGIEIATIVAMVAATLVSLLLTALGLVGLEAGMTAVSVFATVGIWFARRPGD